ncbi:MAG TPA: excinuclease ABC subunit UvrC [Burkholderiales bacterium]|nr:excinuclease ABC subunit UvrC [Burkholderiales bacterium]
MKQVSDERMFNAKEIISGLPHMPGVYRMLNTAGKVIYVGKALDLKKRVSSYFQKTLISPRIQLMVSQVAQIETTVTRSEAEALLLENNLIKSLTPQYNILFRDDKSYPYIIVTEHRFPRLGFHRGALEKKNRYFGPYPNAWAVRESIQLLQKVFRIRTCEDNAFDNRSRPCLLYQIKRCTAPCVNLIDETTYHADVENAMLFLQGKQHRVLQILTQKMQDAADKRDYELAALYRDQVQSLRKIQEKQFVRSHNEVDVDIVACVARSGLVCVNVVMIRGGRHLGDKSFFPQHAEGYDPAIALEAFLLQHYLDRKAPQTVIINQPINGGTLQAALSDHAGHKVQIFSRTVGERRVWLNMAIQNATLAIEQKRSSQATQDVRLHTLLQILGLPASVQRIECFDISHTMGEATMGSCVVFDNLSMQSSEYRRYNIEDITPGDDIAAMREVLTRRYRKIAAGEGKIPDLILVDGGKGQVNTAKEILSELGLNDIFLIGVAKGEERKPGLEQLVFPGNEKPLQLATDNVALHLIQQIRDEAHRFAIQGHRAKRARARVTSSLEHITEVGAKRRQKLLARFGGLRGVLAASVDDLTLVEGISRRLAEKIYRELH